MPQEDGGSIEGTVGKITNGAVQSQYKNEWADAGPRQSFSQRCT